MSQKDYFYYIFSCICANLIKLIYVVRQDECLLWSSALLGTW